MVRAMRIRRCVRTCMRCVRAYDRVCVRAYVRTCAVRAAMRTSDVAYGYVRDAYVRTCGITYRAYVRTCVLRTDALRAYVRTCVQ
jgi:hypothetical protein